MAYQIYYYADRAMRCQLPDTDTIGDDALLHYAAPTGREVASATYIGDPSRDYYGYDGGWHRQPPREAIAADAHDERTRDTDEWAARLSGYGVVAGIRKLKI